MLKSNFFLNFIEAFKPKLESFIQIFPYEDFSSTYLNYNTILLNFRPFFVEKIISFFLHKNN